LGSESHKIDNRNVPPLRPNVINLLADEFPHLELVTNGGIQSAMRLQCRVSYREDGGGPMIGAMVERAVITHSPMFLCFGQLYHLGKQQL
jgi:hypothetical protein